MPRHLLVTRTNGSTAARYKCPARGSSSRQRPHHAGSTGSLPHTEVKQRWVRIVLRWVTAWEHRMPLASFCPRPEPESSQAQPSLCPGPPTTESGRAQPGPGPHTTEPGPDFFTSPAAHNPTRPANDQVRPPAARPGPARPSTHHATRSLALPPASGPGGGLTPPENTQICPARALRAHSSRSLSIHRPARAGSLDTLENKEPGLGDESIRRGSPAEHCCRQALCPGLAAPSVSGGRTHGVPLWRTLKKFQSPNGERPSTAVHEGPRRPAQGNNIVCALQHSPVQPEHTRHSRPHARRHHSAWHSLPRAFAAEPGPPEGRPNHTPLPHGENETKGCRVSMKTHTHTHSV